MNAPLMVTPPPAPASLWRPWLEAGQAALDRGATDLAAAWLEEAVEALGDTADEQRRGITQGLLAFALMRRGDLAAATNLAKTALANLVRASGPGIDLPSARVHHVLAVSHAKAGDIVQHRQHAKHALERYARAAPGSAEFVELALQLAEAEVAAGDLPAASAAWRRAASASSNDSSVARPARARVLVRLTAMALQGGQFRDGEHWSEAWLDLHSKPDGLQLSTAEFRTAVVVFAELHRRLGQTDRARQWLALVSDERCSDLPAPTATDVRRVREQVELELVSGELTRAAALLATIANLPSAVAELQADVRLTKGRLAELDGRLRDAAAHWTQVAQSSASPRCARVEARVGCVRILAAQRQGSIAEREASELVRQAEGAAGGTTVELGLSLAALADSVLAGREPVKARPIAEHALRVLELTLGPGHPATAEVLRILADWAWSAVRPEEGLRYCSEAFMQSPAGPVGMFARARIGAARGRLLHLLGRLAEAHSEFWDSIVKFHGLQPHDLGHPEAGYVHLDLATLAVGGGCPDEAAHQFLEATLRLTPALLSADLLAFELTRRGHVYFNAERFLEADWLYARSVELYRQRFGAKHEFTRQAEDYHRKTRNRLEAPRSTTRNDRQP